MSEEQHGALQLTGQVDRARIMRRLGPHPSGTAVDRASREYLEADDALRAGRPVPSALAQDPDFPTGVGQALIAAGLIWQEPRHVPAIALRVAKDLFAAGDVELASEYAQMVQETAQPGTHDAEAWASQSLLVAILTKAGQGAAADVLARDLVAHGVEIDLWQDADPTLPEDALDWHGGVLVEGVAPRADGRAVTVEDVQQHLQALLADTWREAEADEAGESAQD